MNTSVNPSMLIEQKRAELQVKLTILKENLKNLKNEISNENNINSATFINSMNITSLEQLSSEYKAANDLHELKNYEQLSLENELKKENETLEGLRIYCNNLNKEKANFEDENNFYKNKIIELKDKVEKLKKVLYESQNRKLLLNEEVELLKNEEAINKQLKYKNDQINSNTDNQQEFLNYQLNTNGKKIKLLQIKIDNLNEQVLEMTNDIEKYKTDNEQLKNYNEQLENRLLIMNENVKTYDNKILLLKQELDETRDYIQSSEKEKGKLSNQLQKLCEVLEKINKANIKINANLHIIMKSLEKKKDFMNNENNFFDNCDQAKTKLIEICREIDSYGNLI